VKLGTVVEGEGAEAAAHASDDLAAAGKLSVLAAAVRLA